MVCTLFAVQGAGAAPFDCREEVPGANEKLLSQVEARYREVSVLQAEFFQSSFLIGVDRSEVSKGSVFFKKPGMMDWVYNEPEKQRFVSDGKTIWYYQPALNQTTITEFKNTFETELPVTFLLGIGSLVDSFNLKRACLGEEGIVLELQPKKSEGNLSGFSLLVNPRDYSPLGARTLDAGGNETTILLMKVVVNPPKFEHPFTFDIPRGVDIIDKRE